MFSYHFPKLDQEGYIKTSEYSENYNCIAWAADDNTRKWWPDNYLVGYWPPGVTRSVTLEAFIEAYATLGYIPCESDVFEADLEKIAIYAKAGAPTHAARQLQNGYWTSKLGFWGFSVLKRHNPL